MRLEAKLLLVLLSLSATNIYANENIYLKQPSVQVKLGWQIIEGQKYYITPYGPLSNGIHMIDLVQYGFKEDGSLLINGQIGNYQTDEHGIVKNSVIEHKQNYIVETPIPDGVHTIDGIKYGFKDGKLLINGYVDTYKTNDKGKIIGKAPANRENYKAFIIEKLNTFGWSEKGVYDAVRHNYKYKYMDSKGDTIDDVIYLLNNGKASCYAYASLAYHMWLEMGYEAKYIVGIGRLGDEHAWIAVKKPEGWSYYDTIYRQTPYTEKQLIDMGYDW
ncbi:hypothetical protein AN639_05000 [Candidatus Epulonipiscium fishelsonii]|uniref:Uncharacterized protein n=1 Tax=Candidatus Epulonipiscium fishelsonii TaxID=77094 RepID=A0ACC8XFV1_9FIRM|nr:hypothetical protein AN639_05000 [Epulopiscium sp. SCG-B05WGA-EpuloA1]ONI42312.1 hypothetical protein AN396_01930 [Epulopiscium sp. SCG-B11WGA-EpuloA1]ONI47985.1 hypothetical protein AN644_03130 [Epulopiscium sp. SCG-C06WGA-EpuloA1]